MKALRQSSCELLFRVALFIKFYSDNFRHIIFAHSVMRAKNGHLWPILEHPDKRDKRKAKEPMPRNATAWEY